jgi:hypothetical protein
MSRRIPAPSPHEPTGDFAPPPAPQGLVCWCGTALTRVSNDATDPRYLDWTVVDEQGRGWIDITPAFRYRKPDGEIIVIDMHDADAWDRLAKVDIGKYSMLKVAYDMGFPFSHVHHEDLTKTPSREAPLSDPPRCHGQWMWAAPDGWRCRSDYGAAVVAPYAVSARP